MRKYQSRFIVNHFFQSHSNKIDQQQVCLWEICDINLDMTLISCDDMANGIFQAGKLIYKMVFQRSRLKSIIMKLIARAIYLWFFAAFF